MNVLLDPQIFLTQKFGGISRLHAELWKYLRSVHIHVECPLTYSENFHLQDAGLQPKNIFNVFNHIHFKGTGKIKDKLKAASLRRTIRKIQQKDFDVFISTYYDPYFLEYLRGTPFILTVYDMIHEIFPEYFVNDKKTVPQKKMLLEKADRIVAISQQTKKDILQFYPSVPAEKIDVVYLAQSISDNDIIPPVDLPDNFILFIGNRANYKNFNFLAETIASMLKDDPSLYLVCAGGGRLETSEIQFLDKLGIRMKVIQRTYKDNELPAFYKKAMLFVFPSLYEGFGIPTLEAMKCGCPVVLANTGCLPEIGGDAASYFEVGNKESLTDVVKRLLNDEDFRNQIVQKGFIREKEFSWSKTAEGYLAVIHQLAA